MKKTSSVLMTIILVLTLFTGVSSAAASQVGSSGKYELSSGFGLYANIQGQVTANPTVVFISGYGDDSTAWSEVQAAVSQYALTVSYDRAGLGLSDDTDKDKTARQQAKDLHKLLRKAKIPGPYLLVGHSIGGLNVRVFADLYKDEVAGAVFVDSSHENQEEAILATFPPELLDLYMGQFTAEGSYAEVTKSMQQAADTREHDNLRDVPLTVISATDHGVGPETEEIWAELQDDLATLSDYSRHVVSPATGHYVQLEKPQLVIDEIVALFARL